MILIGNSEEVLKTLEDNSVDSIVTDPPYGLSFMGKKWDYDVPSQEIWAECLRVLKPGGYLLSFAGTRTQHRMAVRIEDAGFEIRDMIAWVYGSGFPKSRNIGKDMEKKAVGGIKNLKQIGTKQGIKVETGTQGFSYSKEYVAGKSMGGRQISGKIPVYEINNDWGGWGTALKPALEPITVARKPISEKNIAENVLKWGTGGINIDGTRVGSDTIKTSGGRLPEEQEDKKKQGVMGRLKSIEPLNTTHTGRFPANLIHDGSDEVVGLFPDSKSGNGKASTYEKEGGQWGNGKQIRNADFGDSGSASRFFYCAKASKSERNAGLDGFENNKPMYESHRPNYKNTKGIETPYAGAGRTGNANQNNHPTVKPVALMRYLVKLVTPVNGTVLDPFNGSGTTGIAAKLENFDYIGIELEEEYVKISEARIAAWQESQEKLF